MDDLEVCLDLVEGGVGRIRLLIHFAFDHLVRGKVLAVVVETSRRTRLREIA